MSHVLIVPTEPSDHAHTIQHLACAVSADSLREWLRVMDEVAQHNYFYIVDRTQVFVPKRPRGVAPGEQKWRLLPEDQSGRAPRAPRLDLLRAEVLRGTLILAANLSGGSTVVQAVVFRQDIDVMLEQLSAAPAEAAQTLS